MNENENLETVDSTTEVETDSPKYTQSDFDKQFSQARKKWEKDSQEQIKKAQQLAQMDESQRKQQELDDALKKISELERKASVDANMKEAIKVMASRGVPAELADILVTDDNEQTLANIKVIEKAIKDEVNAQVKAKLGGSAPKQGAEINKEMTREQFQICNVLCRN